MEMYLEGRVRAPNFRTPHLDMRRLSDNTLPLLKKNIINSAHDMNVALTKTLMVHIEISSLQILCFSYDVHF